MKAKLNPNFEKFVDEQEPQVIIALKDSDEKLEAVFTSRVEKEEAEQIVIEFALNYLADHAKGSAF